MVLAVEIQAVSASDRLPAPAQLTAWARAAWQDPARDAEVVIRLTDEDESRRLNRAYRGKDRPTNVLSFSYGPMPGIAPDQIGDLLVCVPVVEREARAQGKTREAHWAHMVVHGMLHLQGHDHEDDRQARVMECLETEILTGLGFPAPYADDEVT